MKRNILQILLIPLLIFVALRLPSLFESYWYGDEGIYAAVSQEIFEGRKLYQGVWDHKPPLIFLIYYFGAKLGWDIGFPLLKLFNLFLGIATIITVLFILLKLNFKKNVYILGLLFLSIILGSTVLEGNSLNAEVIFILFNTLAFLLLLYKKYFIGVGFLLFMSLMTKMPGFLEVVFMSLIFAITYIRDKGFVFVKQFIVKTFLGFIIPLIVLLLYFYFQNTLNDFIYGNFTFNALYSLHEDNYFSAFNLLIPNTILKLISLISVFLISSFWYWKKRLSKEVFIIINLFSVQIFSSLLSGKNYGHYFIQVLSGATLLISLTIYRLRQRLNILQYKMLIIFLVLFLPLFLVLISVGLIPINAPPIKYYSTFYSGYVLGNKEKQTDFWWRNGDGVQKTIGFSNYFNHNYLDYKTVYIYTDKPWIIALTEKQKTNKYIVWFHLSYSKKHLEEGISNIENSELVVVDNDVDLLEPISELLLSDFEKINTFENFDIYQKI